jgi:hypothetical protein
MFQFKLIWGNAIFYKWFRKHRKAFRLKLSFKVNVGIK